MSDNSKIAWTDATWNVLVGCTKISAGCSGCSALRDAQRLRHNPNEKIEAKYGGTVAGDGRNWSGVINFSQPDLLTPLEWRKPRRIFPNYTSDWAHVNVLDSWRDQIFAVMALADWHTYQLLTKRSDVALRYISGAGLGNSWNRFVKISDEMFRIVAGNSDARWVKFAAERLAAERARGGYECPVEIWPLRHVWLGFSAEDQPSFDERWADFKHIAEAGWTVTVSAEPLLGRIDLPREFLKLGKRTQVIVGGESGSKARPVRPSDIRHLRDQCIAAGVRFFFKQWGEYSPLDGVVPNPGRYPVYYFDMGRPTRETVYRVGKKNAGRMLDGVLWGEFPETQNVLREEVKQR